jgi:hypothetical protein
MTYDTLDGAYHRLRATGPEFDGWLSNHGPMAAEALVRHGHEAQVAAWLDGYCRRLEAAPGAGRRIDDWRTALGDPRRLGDWLGFFDNQLRDQPGTTSCTRGGPALFLGLQPELRTASSGSATPSASCVRTARPRHGSLNLLRGSDTGRHAGNRYPAPSRPAARSARKRPSRRCHVSPVSTAGSSQGSRSWNTSTAGATPSRRLRPPPMRSTSFATWLPPPYADTPPTPTATP